MKTIFTPQNIDTVLNTYHGFHDADIVSITLPSYKDGTSFLDVEIELIATNFQTRNIEKVKLLFQKVSKMQLKYDMNCDYPNVRDDIAIGFFESLVYVDFGAACEARTTPEDFLALDNFFVCESASLYIQG